MGLRRLLEDHCSSPCIQQVEEIASKLGLTEIKASDWVDGVQVVTSLIGALWIIYQFNRLRRSAEKDLEDYLKRHLDEKLHGFKKERMRVLPVFSQVTQASGLYSLAMRSIALGKRLLFALLKLLPFVPNPSELSHALVLYRTGSAHRAQRKFDALGNNLLDLAALYKKQAEIKRLEAGNAFLYAGCAAASAGDTSGSFAAFKRVLDDDVTPNDPDAYELTGRQHLNANSVQQALHEFERLREVAVANGEIAHGKHWLIG